MTETLLAEGFPAPGRDTEDEGVIAIATLAPIPKCVPTGQGMNSDHLIDFEESMSRR